MNRYDLALLVLSVAALPLFCVSGWLGVAALIAIYSLVARLANKDFERSRRRSSRLHPNVVGRVYLSQEFSVDQKRK
jgi:hypothetical protein